MRMLRKMALCGLLLINVSCAMHVVEVQQGNIIKPEMVAEATRDARNSAQQFAEDSGAGVGGIRQATQGYFEIAARDGDGGGWGSADTPFKTVRVVTTVDFYLE